MSILYRAPFLQHTPAVLPILPAQVGLRYLQINASTLIKDHTTPLLGFGSIGVLQGIVYGHANRHFAPLFQGANHKPFFESPVRLRFLPMAGEGI